MGTPRKTSASKPTISGALRDTIRQKGLTAYAAAKRSGVSVDKLAGSLGLTLCPDDKPAGGEG